MGQNNSQIESADEDADLEHPQSPSEIAGEFKEGHLSSAFNTKPLTNSPTTWVNKRHQSNAFQALHSRKKAENSIAIPKLLKTKDNTSESIVNSQIKLVKQPTRASAERHKSPELKTFATPKRKANDDLISPKRVQKSAFYVVTPAAKQGRKTQPATMQKSDELVIGIEQEVLQYEGIRIH